MPTKLFRPAFILCLLFFTSNLDAQNLTYTDLKYLLEHDVEEADNYISAKGYKFLMVEKKEDNRCETMNWSFKRNTTTDKAVAFVAKYCLVAREGFIWYQLNNRKHFDQIKTTCKNLGFKVGESETDELGQFNTTYKTSKYTIKFTSGIDSDNLNLYFITLSLNYDE